MYGKSSFLVRSWPSATAIWVRLLTELTLKGVISKKGTFSFGPHSLIHQSTLL